MPVNAALFKAKATKCQGWLILVGVKQNSFKLIFSGFQFPALPRSILHPLFLSPNLYFCLSLSFYLKNTKSSPTLTSAPQLQLYVQAPAPPLTFLMPAKPQMGGCSRGQYLCRQPHWSSNLDFQSNIAKWGHSRAEVLKTILGGGEKLTLIIYSRSVWIFFFKYRLYIFKLFLWGLET